MRLGEISSKLGHVATFTTLLHLGSKCLCDLITPPPRLKPQRHWPG
jgi:hypothetical protein